MSTNTHSTECSVSLGLYSNERVALFVDGSNLYSTARALNFDIDYHRLLDVFTTRASLVRAYYYTALIDETEFSHVKRLVDWLDYNKYTVITKQAKEFIEPGTGRKKIKGNMDIEMVIGVVELVMSGRIDHVVLFTGDGDFRSLVEFAQRQGVRVTVISSIMTSPPMIADELRRQADNFIDIYKLKDCITRTGERTYTSTEAAATAWRERHHPDKPVPVTADVGNHREVKETVRPVTDTKIYMFAAGDSEKTPSVEITSITSFNKGTDKVGVVIGQSTKKLVNRARLFTYVTETDEYIGLTVEQIVHRILA